MDVAADYRENVMVLPAEGGTWRDRLRGAVGGSAGESADSGRTTDEARGAGASGAWSGRSQRVCSEEQKARLTCRMRRMAWLLDAAILIPGLRTRVGLDAAIGLIPFVGDACGTLLSLYIVLLAWRIGVRREILALMLLNVLIDFVMGLTPIFGDSADILFKANVRNIALLGLTARW